MSASYVVRMPATAVTAAKTLIQITAGAAPLVILDAKVDQITKTDHEQLNIQVVRKTGAATVTSATPAKLQTLDAASNASAGYNASVEGTDGDVLEDLAWNVISGSWGLLSIDDQIVVPPNGVVALKLMTAPAASMSLRAMVKFKELPGVEAWTPLSDANLRFWLKADSLSLTDGDPIAAVADSSGNGYDAAQVTGAQKPTYKTGIVGGKPVMRFDGTDDNLQVPNGAFPWAGTYTIYVVMQSTDSDFAVFSSQKSGGSGGVNVAYGASLLGSGRLGVNTVAIGNEHSAVTLDGSFHLYTMEDTGAAHVIYKDGTSLSVTQDFGYGASIDSTIAWALGARNEQGVGLPSDLYFTGDVAEIWIVEGAPSAPGRALHHAYVAAKYGLTIA